MPSGYGKEPNTVGARIRTAQTYGAQFLFFLKCVAIWSEGTRLSKKKKKIDDIVMQLGVARTYLGFAHLLGASIGLWAQYVPYL